MAGKSPEKPPREEKPATGRSRTTAASPAEGPSSIPPTPVISPMLARRLGARVLDPETAVLAPGQPAPLPTVYVADTLLVRDVADPQLDAEGRASRVEELTAFASKQLDSVVLEPVGDPVEVPHRGDKDSLGPDARVTVTRVRLARDPSKAGKIPDAWRFLQSALTEPSERGSLLYDKLGLGRLPDPPEGEEQSDAQRRRRERRDRRGRSMASGVSVEHVLTAGGGIWGGGGGIWGGGGGIWGGGGGIGAAVAASGAVAACSRSTARPASVGAAPSSGRHPTRVPPRRP